MSQGVSLAAGCLAWVFFTFPKCSEGRDGLTLGIPSPVWLNALWVAELEMGYIQLETTVKSGKGMVSLYS